MWFAYLDESKQDNRICVYSALVVDGNAWNEVFAAVKALRRELRDRHGIFINKELHASKFAAGKGRIAPRPIDEHENEFIAFERLMNRMNRTAQARGHSLLLFCDEGQEAIFVKRIRRMRVHNHIWSNRGVWAETGNETKNIPIENIIEDPIFKDSRTSYFIQLVDFCAFALLRSERPIPSKTALGYDQMYEILRPITLPINNKRDHRGLGIIR